MNSVYTVDLMENTQMYMSPLILSVPFGVCSVDLIETTQMPPAMPSELRREPRVTTYIKASDLSSVLAGALYSCPRITMTSMDDPWSTEQSIRDAVVTVPTVVKRMLIEDLGWTREQTVETRLRLRAFEEDWDAHGMELYDEL